MSAFNKNHVTDFLFASRRFFLASGASILFLPAAPALAQYGGGRRARKPQAEATPSLEITLHELHEDLKLRPDQEPLFDAYADKVRAFAQDVSRERQRQKTAGTTRASVIERIDRVLDTMRNRLTAEEDIAQAAKTLYARLDSGQQLAADPRLASVMLMPLGGATPA